MRANGSKVQGQVPCEGGRTPDAPKAGPAMKGTGWDRIEGGLDWGRAPCGFTLVPAAVSSSFARRRSDRQRQLSMELAATVSGGELAPRRVESSVAR